MCAEGCSSRNPREITVTDIFISYHRPRCDRDDLKRILADSMPALRGKPNDPVPKIEFLTDDELRTIATALGIEPLELLGHRWLVQRLKNQGWSVWWDNDLLAGDEWWPRIEDALQSARCVIALCTEESLKHPWIIHEAGTALRSEKLIPLLLGAAKLPVFWGRIQHDDITGWRGGEDEPQYQRVAAAIQQKIGPPRELRSHTEAFLDDILNTPVDERWKGQLVHYIASPAGARTPLNNGTSQPCGGDAISKLLRAVSKKKLSSSAVGRTPPLLSEIEYWLRDEKIIVTSTRLDAIPAEALQRRKLSISDVRTPNDWPIEIWSKTDWSSRHARSIPASPTSLVVQCMFVIIGDDNRFSFAIHDRSYTGAEDARSQYALVTGRLAWEDMKFQWEENLGIILAASLERELQEIDELNLTSTLAGDYSSKAKFVGAFPNHDRSILSFVHVIELKPDEFEQINRRGPYLIPVTPEHYAKLHFLGLLGAILNTNSCANCNTELASNAIRSKTGCEKIGHPCIIQAVLRTCQRDPHPLEPAEVTHKTGKPSNAVILLADIVNFRTLTERGRRDLMIQLNSYLSAWLPKVPSGLGSRVNCAEGRLRIVFWRNGDPTSAPPNDALAAYFLSLYMSLKLEELASYLPGTISGLDTPTVSLRIPHQGCGLDMMCLQGVSCTLL